MLCFPPFKVPENSRDCHTSDICHWFAMTCEFSHFFGSLRPPLTRGLGERIFLSPCSESTSLSRGRQCRRGGNGHNENFNKKLSLRAGDIVHPFAMTVFLIILPFMRQAHINLAQISTAEFYYMFRIRLFPNYPFLWARYHPWQAVRLLEVHIRRYRFLCFLL